MNLDIYGNEITDTGTPVMNNSPVMNNRNTDYGSGYEEARLAYATSPEGQRDEYKRNMYGETGSNLGKNVDNISSRLTANLDKNVARADLYNQTSGRNRALASRKAGMSNIDTGALDEQSRINAGFGASAINETAKRQALGDYRDFTGNIMTNVNKDDQNFIANQIASKPIEKPEESNWWDISSWF